MGPQLGGRKWIPIRTLSLDLPNPPPPKHSRKDEKTGGMTSKPRDEAQGKSKKMEDKATGRPSFPSPKKDRDVKTGVKNSLAIPGPKTGILTQ